MKSTKKDQKSEVLIADLPSKQDQQIDKLQSDLETFRDTQNEERYWAGFFCAFIFDAFVANHISFGTFSLLFLLQLVPMIYFAKKLGIDDVVVMLDRIGSIITRKIDDKTNKD